MQIWSMKLFQVESRKHKQMPDVWDNKYVSNLDTCISNSLWLYIQMVW